MAAPPQVEMPDTPPMPEPASPGPRSLHIGKLPEGELDSLPTMRLIEDRTAMLFAQELGHAFQASIEVSVQDARIQKWGECMEAMASPGCHSLIELEALGGHAIISMEQGLFFGLLELLFGHSGGGQFGGRPRARFSAVEERVIRRIIHLFGRSMEVAWRPVVPMNVAHLRIEAKPASVNICNRDDAVVVTDYAVKFPGHEGTLSLISPKSLLMGFRERLSTGRYEKTPRQKDSWKDAITGSLQEMPLELVAELGRASLALKDLLELEVGQVLRLDTAPHDPIKVNINDVPKYAARATVHHGNLAVELEALI